MWTSSLPSIHSARRLTWSDWRSPGGDRVVVGRQAGRVEEVLVVAQRHPRLARVRVRREERQRPAVLAGGGALHRRLHQRLARLLRPRACFLGSAPESARVFTSAIIAMRTSAFSAAHSRVRRDPVELLVAGELEEGGLRAVGGQLHDRQAAGTQHLLVHGLHQRLGGGRGLDHADVALAAPASSSGRGSGRAPPRAGPSCGHFRIARAASGAGAVSPVSSGWKATARMLPWRTATGWPSTSASTSTSAPTRSTQGARMNTARSGPSAARSSSASKRCDLAPEGVAAHASRRAGRGGRGRA